MAAPLESTPHVMTPRPRWLPILATLIMTSEVIWMTVWNLGVIRKGGDAWQTGDWLVNYEAGLVRRGASGQLVMAIADGNAVLSAVLVLQLVLLITLVAAGLSLFWLSPRTPAWFAVTLSPAFLLFPFLSAEGGLRKELYALAAAGIAALALRLAWRWLALVPVLVLFVVGAFSHEIVPLTLPFFLFILWSGMARGMWSGKVAATWGLFFVAASVGGLAVSLMAPGSGEQVAAICDSWVQEGLWVEADLVDKYCAGAVSALDDGVVFALRQTVGSFPSYLALVLPLTLAAVPFFLVRLRRSLRFLAVILGLALLPLFLVGIDYGRWVFVLASLLSLACLALVSTQPQGEVSIRPWQAILFVSVWSLPYTGVTSSNSLVMQLIGSAYQTSAEWLANSLGMN